MFWWELFALVGVGVAAIAKAFAVVRIVAIALRGTRARDRADILKAATGIAQAITGFNRRPKGRKVRGPEDRGTDSEGRQTCTCARLDKRTALDSGTAIGREDELDANRPTSH
jgi:hypothetical protein